MNTGQKMTRTLKVEEITDLIPKRQMLIMINNSVLSLIMINTNYKYLNKSKAYLYRV